MKSKGKRRWLRWGVGLILAYTIFGFLIAPFLIKAIVLWQLPKKIHRAIALDKVRVNPYTIAITLGGFEIKETNGTPFVKWDEVYANLDPTALIQSQLRLSDVTISNAYAHVQINPDGTFNFSDILATLTSAPSHPSKSSSGRPLVIRLDRLQVSGSRVDYQDLSRSTPFATTIGPIDVSLTDFSSDPANRNPYGFTAATESGEKIAWRGFFFLSPIRSSGEFSVASVPLKKYAPYYNDFVSLAMHDGTLDVSSTYRVEFTDHPTIAQVSNLAVRVRSLKISDLHSETNLVDLANLQLSNTFIDAIAQVAQIGDLTVHGANFQVERLTNGQINLLNWLTPPAISNHLSAVTTASTSSTNPPPSWHASVRHLNLENWHTHVTGIVGEQDASWQSLKVVNIRARSYPVSLYIDSVILTGPNLQNLIPESLTNLLTALPKSESANASATNTAPVSTPPLAVGLIIVTNGIVGYTDKSLDPPAAISLDQWNVSVKNLSSDAGSRADIIVNGRVDNIAPLELHGHINPMSMDAATDLQVTLKNVDLLPLGSYSGRYLGYLLRKGHITLSMQYDIDQRRLNAKNQILVDQFTFGEATGSSQALKLPVKLGVAILKDRNGRIQLDVPIEGRIDDPKFHYWGAVWQVLGNLFTKIFTAPFSMLGSMFGGGEELSYQEFTPGSATIVVEQTKKLDVLVKAMTERPSLNLEISGSIDPVQDIDPLKRQKLDDILLDLRSRKEPANTNAFTAVERAAYLRQLYTDALPRLHELQATNQTPVVVTNSFQSNISNVTAANPKTTAAPAVISASQAKKTAASTSVAEMERQYLALIELAPEDYRRLANARAAAVLAYFKANSQIDPSRLLISTSITAPVPREGARAVFSLQ